MQRLSIIGVLILVCAPGLVGCGSSADFKPKEPASTTAAQPDLANMPPEARKMVEGQMGGQDKRNAPPAGK